MRCAPRRGAASVQRMKTGGGGWAVAALALGMWGCGGDDSGGGGGGGYTPTTPPADVCALLPLTDVQVFFPAALSSAAEPVNDPVPNVWTRTCSYSSKPTGPSLDTVDLVVYGAKDADGVKMLTVLAGGMGTKKTPVSGIGDQATYWEQDTSNVGLVAKQGSYAVDVTAYFMTPFPSQDQLGVAVKKVLGQL